jgi:hypothetical protein
MPIRIRFNVNAKDVIAGLQDIQKDQIPFVLAKSLTKVAQLAQKKIQGGLSKRFHLRRQDWEEKGVVITPAQKKDASPEARVEDRHDYMIRQETGDNKTPTSGTHLAVPISGGAVMAADRSTIIRATKRARQLIAEGKAFIKGDIIFVRRGRGQRKAVAAYVLKSSVPIKPRLHFEDDVEAVLPEFPRIFAANMKDAMKDKFKFID